MALTQQDAPAEMVLMEMRARAPMMLQLAVIRHQRQTFTRFGPVESRAKTAT